MKTKAKPVINLAERFAGTHPAFQAELQDISAEGGLAVLDVYALWREYIDQCFDQSALVWEFRRWYASKLGLKAS